MKTPKGLYCPIGYMELGSINALLAWHEPHDRAEGLFCCWPMERLYDKSVCQGSGSLFCVRHADWSLSRHIRKLYLMFPGAGWEGER